MKKVVISILLLLLLPALSFSKDYGDYQGAVYVSNYDGDTIKFDLLVEKGLVTKEEVLNRMEKVVECWHKAKYLSPRDGTLSGLCRGP